MGPVFMGKSVRSCSLDSNLLCSATCWVTFIQHIIWPHRVSVFSFVKWTEWNMELLWRLPSVSRSIKLLPSSPALSEEPFTWKYKKCRAEFGLMWNKLPQVPDWASSVSYHRNPCGTCTLSMWCVWYYCTGFMNFFPKALFPLVNRFNRLK